MMPCRVVSCFEIMKKRMWIGNYLELHVRSILCDENMMNIFCQGIGSDVLGDWKLLQLQNIKPTKDHNIFMQNQPT
jgi:hypothetical protein